MYLRCARPVKAKLTSSPSGSYACTTCTTVLRGTSSLHHTLVPRVPQCWEERLHCIIRLYHVYHSVERSIFTGWYACTTCTTVLRVASSLDHRLVPRVPQCWEERLHWQVRVLRVVRTPGPRRWRWWRWLGRWLSRGVTVHRCLMRWSWSCMSD